MDTETGSRGHIAVVGGGIVGIACAAALQRDGWRITLIDPAGIAERTSKGNAGGIAWTTVSPLASPGIWRKIPGWLFDPNGPLAIRPSYALRLLPWLIRFALESRPSRLQANSAAIVALQSLALPAWERLASETGARAELRHPGCLELYDSERTWQAAQSGFDDQRAHGIELQEIPVEALPQMEPALTQAVRAGTIKRAMFDPGWAQVSDPQVIAHAVWRHVAARGAVHRAAAVSGIETGADSVTVRLDGGEAVEADRVVVSAGAWSASLTRALGDRVPLETERGYNATISSPGVALNRLVYFSGHGFVASPVAAGLRVGGAVELGGLDLPPNPKRIDAFLGCARRFLPDLNEDGRVDWMGHRPSLPDSRPVIGPSRRDSRIVYAFGHGHHGLTQSAATGELVADLIAGRTPPIPLAPYSAQRF